MKCDQFPKEVLEKFRQGATEVEHESSQWNGNAKFIERRGEKIIIKYHKNDIPKSCLRDKF